VKLGLGVAYVTSHVELKQNVDFSQQLVPSAAVPPGTRFAALGIPTGTDFAQAHLDASGNGVAFNAGVIVMVTDRFSIGGHYLTRAKIDYDGDATFTQIPTGLVLPLNNPINPSTPVPIDLLVEPNFAAGAPLADTRATTSITMPNQASLGVAWRASDAVTVMADYQTVRWRWFETLYLDFENAAAPDLTLNENYRNTHGFRFGAEWTRSDRLTLRGGYLYHSAAAPPQTVTPLLPEGARNEFTVGLGWRLTPKLQADVGYQYIRQNDRRGRVNEETVGNTGLYKFKANLLGFGLAYTF
jgi:long-chain fatty acid transport protein